jgi:hypothetical protein
MADRETLLNLAADEAAVAAFVAGCGGRLIRDQADPATYWLTMHPAEAATEMYYIKVTWSVYPGQAPSVKFADAIGGSLTVKAAWPVIPGYRADSFDICKPMTAEGFALHQEWQSGPDLWPTEGNPFVWLAEMLQYDLDNSYNGRAA